MTVGGKMLVVAALYFAEGFPFGLVWDTLPVYFRLQGVSLKEIGLMSLVSLPWSFKFLWAPAVDRWGHLRRWIAGTQWAMAALLLAAGALGGMGPGALLWAWLLGLAALCATQDIAVDAYTIRILEQREMGAANGVRVSAYRVALILSGGVMVALGGAAGWGAALVLCGGVMALLGVFSQRLDYPQTGGPDGGGRHVLEPLRDLLRRPMAVHVALFVLLYKLGDMAMGPMVRPFWVDRGLTTGEMGFITGTGGIVASITGALVGGAFTSRFGIYQGLWFLGIWQALSNLGYALVAMDPATGHWGVYGASMLESFCGGLGTAGFLAFLMSICEKKWAATQYALLSALFGLTRSISGAASGWLATGLGYGDYFAVTFVLAAPAFIFLRGARSWIRENAGGEVFMDRE
jgi:PAT family beta-lactamase induction signal transducer AmpG